MIQVSALTVYPVKSLQGIALTAHPLKTQGLAYDRSWMVVDRNSRFVTQRQLPALASIQVELSTNRLRLAHPDHPAACEIGMDSPPGGKCVTVNVWNDECTGFDQGDEVSRWLEQILSPAQGDSFRLVRFDRRQPRAVDASYLGHHESNTEFADGFPFLLTNEKSLDALNDRLRDKGANPVTMDRFRPNIVISGADAFSENQIAELHHREAQYGIALRKPCQRCKVTSIDQKTSRINEPKEPLKTLAAMNPFERLPGAFFGQNAILLSGEGQTICVGDELRVVSA